ncbi:hypothetical protein, partial [Rubrivirga sp.]|uniref:hypothetical protein n=1 Tax=Rubrivirga sp. TaxID=1885344 RepID=UPI003C781F54
PLRADDLFYGSFMSNCSIKTLRKLNPRTPEVTRRTAVTGPLFMLAGAMLMRPVGAGASDRKADALPETLLSPIALCRVIRERGGLLARYGDDSLVCAPRRLVPISLEVGYNGVSYLVAEQMGGCSRSQVFGMAKTFRLKRFQSLAQLSGTFALQGVGPDVPRSYIKTIVCSRTR